jgi:uncharacterized LabA/DUF88 family protein
MSTQTLPTSPRNPWKAAVFIDGAHLSRTLRTVFPDHKVAFDKLATALAGGSELLRAYYYDALPFLAEQPSEEDAHRYAQRQRFFHALRQLPRFVVREGRTARAWDAEHSRWTYRQKSVDVGLASDLVRLSAKRCIDVAILVTGDADFVPAIEAAREEGVQVRLVTSPDPRRTGRDLASAVDERVVLDEAILRAAARPANSNNGMVA